MSSDVRAKRGGCIIFAMLVLFVFPPRLFMSTTSAAYRVPAQLSAVMNVVEMCLSREGLEELFLDRFMELEKSRIQDSKSQTVSVSRGSWKFWKREDYRRRRAAREVEKERGKETGKKTKGNGQGKKKKTRE